MCVYEMLLFQSQFGADADGSEQRHPLFPAAVATEPRMDGAISCNRNLLSKAQDQRNDI